MKRIRNFVWAKKDGQTDGWLPEDAPEFDPGTSVHVGHDVLEHLSNQTDWKHELLAFGATMFVRGTLEPRQMVDISSQDLASFIAGNPVRNLDIPAANKRWSKPLKDVDAEIRVGTLIFSTGVHLITRHGMVPDQFSKPLDNALGWIRLGYRLAVRVYRGNNGGAVDHLFGRINRHVLLDYNNRKPRIGSRLSVAVDTHTLEHRIVRSTVSHPVEAVV